MTAGGQTREFVVVFTRIHFEQGRGVLVIKISGFGHVATIELYKDLSDLSTMLIPEMCKPTPG